MRNIFQIEVTRWDNLMRIHWVTKNGTCIKYIKYTNLAVNVCVLQGENQFIESLCQTILPLEEILWVLTHNGISYNIKGVYVRYMHWVYMRGSSSLVDSGASELTHDRSVGARTGDTWQVSGCQNDRWHMTGQWVLEQGTHDGSVGARTGGTWQVSGCKNDRWHMTGQWVPERQVTHDRSVGARTIVDAWQVSGPRTRDVTRDRSVVLERASWHRIGQGR